jgi:hypothetical protein
MSEPQLSELEMQRQRAAKNQSATDRAETGALHARLAEVEPENDHLRIALATRIIVEQAKGV